LNICNSVTIPFLQVILPEKMQYQKRSIFVL
jgi:hypothetical protein